MYTKNKHFVFVSTFGISEYFNFSIKNTYRKNFILLSRGTNLNNVTDNRNEND